MVWRLLRNTPSSRNGFDGIGRLDCGKVGSQGKPRQSPLPAHGAPDVAGGAVDGRSGLVLMAGDARRGQDGHHRVGYLALLAGRAWDTCEREEQLGETLA
jgi:hypothetical protein